MKTPLNSSGDGQKRRKMASTDASGVFFSTLAALRAACTHAYAPMHPCVSDGGGGLRMAAAAAQQARLAAACSWRGCLCYREGISHAGNQVYGWHVGVRGAQRVEFIVVSLHELEGVHEPRTRRLAHLYRG